MEPAARPSPGGLALTVRATPRAARDAVEGYGVVAGDREALLVRVRAAPADGAANAAVIRLLAKTFGVPPRAVRLVAGTSARIKRFEIEGDRDQLARIAEAIPQR